MVFRRSQGDGQDIVLTGLPLDVITRAYREATVVQCGSLLSDGHWEYRSGCDGRLNQRMEESRDSSVSSAVENGKISNDIPRDHEATADTPTEQPPLKADGGQSEDEASPQKKPVKDPAESDAIENGQVNPEGTPGEDKNCPPSSDSRAPRDVDENTQQLINSPSTEGEQTETVAAPVTEAKAVSPRKAKRRGIFVSYASEASFAEKQFICYTIKELKHIGFCDDIWFDKDEMSLLGPFCSQERLEIAEKCRAALIFLSKSYVGSKLCRYEKNILLGRTGQDANAESELEKPVELFCIKYDKLELPSEYCYLEERNRMVDLTDQLACASIAEKSSAVVGTYSEALEKQAGPYFGLRVPSPPHEPEDAGQFLKKGISLWNCYDVQEWLAALKLHARFILSFEEQQMDGYMLLSLTESDLENQLNVDSRVARRKILQQIKQLEEKEFQLKEHWYMKHRKVKSKPGYVYVICDPGDAKLAGLVKSDLAKSKLKVFAHERLGQSRQEFLQLNSAALFASGHAVLLLTTGSATSLFVYNELLFADWLGKPILVALMENSWDKLRPCLRATLENAAAVNFEGKPYAEAVDVVAYHLSPLKNLSVILEQSYLDRVADGVKPLKALLAAENQASQDAASSRPVIFISYHLDDQRAVQRLVQYLEGNGLQCWSDMGPVSGDHGASRGAQPQATLQGTMKRNMTRAKAVVCCVTSKYVRFKSFAKDLALADSMHKPIIPVMLQWLSWPPEGDMRRILSPLPCIDMSNRNMFRRNLDTVLTQLKRSVAEPT